MFKRILNPWAVLVGLACGLAALAGQGRALDRAVILDCAGPAPPCRGENRFSVGGRNAVADANRQGPEVHAWD